MADSELGRWMRWSVAIVIVAICVVIASMIYALVAVNSGTPLTDDITYSDEYGPDITIHPGANPGSTPTNGYPVHPYSIFHLWVNATGPVSVIVTDPAGYVIQEADSPIDLSYFAVIGGYYEVTCMPEASNITITLTFTTERLPIPASQSDLNSLRGGLMVSLTLILAAFSAAILLILFLLVRLERRMKGT